MDSKTVLFFRTFRGFHGGHLKVWNYFNHVMHSISFRPLIFFSKDSIWDKSNPWLGLKDCILESRESICPDVFFLAGLDWLMLEKSQRENPVAPIINFIQHVRHSNPKEQLYSFLKYKAIRICVSEEVTEAILKTGQVNGPVFTIPNGIDLQEFIAPVKDDDRKNDLLIAALKNPKFGIKLARKLKKMSSKIDVLITSILRPDYLKRVSLSRVTVFLPHPVEGCYLPPLEGMALGTLVVCPDGIGTSYCLPGYNCFRPEYTVKSVRQAVEIAIHLSEDQVSQMRSNAMQTVAKHDLIKERQTFLEILEDTTNLWRT